ncbi:MAG: phosphoribosylaminoimidazolesuccinocarboxamide synthase [Phycisphaeraceae bacterium]
METNLPYPGRRQGKVRDIYDVTLADGTEAVLIVATDRISAFDVVMPNGIPGKGALLTQISRFWFERFSQMLPHHLISTDPADLPDLEEADRDALRGRIMIGRRCRVLPVECIVRGYLAGSGWKDYQRTGGICGIELPTGLVNGSRLDHPIFTPSTKAAHGHDENISYQQAADIIGPTMIKKLRDLSLRIYSEARDYAAERGILIADTKFEFGVPLETSAEEPILIDEVLTPDSSRFWPADEYREGQEQPSLDKQYVRNYLETLVAAGKWDKTPPGPTLPDEIIENTLTRYRRAYEALTT